MSSLETNQEYSKILEDNVKLTCKAVAVKLLASEEELPEGYDLIDEKVRHCEMIRKASYGEKFYSTIEQQSCLGGAGAIGLRDMPPKLASGEKYFELGRFKDLKTAKAFENMFANEVITRDGELVKRESYLKPKDTTCVQAEVMVFEKIEPSFIKFCVVQTNEHQKRLSEEYSQIKFYSMENTHFTKSLFSDRKIFRSNQR